MSHYILEFVSFNFIVWVLYFSKTEPGCEALCLAICPHDQRYVLVGGSDGVVRLHSTALERPLTSWQSSPDCVPVVDLQWSPARPCVFYVLDANARFVIIEFTCFRGIWVFIRDKYGFILWFSLKDCTEGYLSKKTFTKHLCTWNIHLK